MNKLKDVSATTPLDTVTDYSCISNKYKAAEIVQVPKNLPKNFKSELPFAENKLQKLLYRAAKI